MAPSDKRLPVADHSVIRGQSALEMSGITWHATCRANRRRRVLWPFLREPVRFIAVRLADSKMACGHQRREGPKGRSPPHFTGHLPGAGGQIGWSGLAIG